MPYVVAGLVLVALLVLIVGVARGRVRVRPCCAADPSKDLRMRGAFEPDDDQSSISGVPSKTPRSSR